jgi:hypothetical protein
MNKALRAGVCLMIVTLGLAGCSNTIGTQSEITPGPVGIGRSVNELKGTPCACTEIPMAMPADMQV